MLGAEVVIQNRVRMLGAEVVMVAFLVEFLLKRLLLVRRGVVVVASFLLMLVVMRAVAVAEAEGAWVELLLLLLLLVVVLVLLVLACTDDVVVRAVAVLVAGVCASTMLMQWQSVAVKQGPVVVVLTRAPEHLRDNSNPRDTASVPVHISSEAHTSTGQVMPTASVKHMFVACPSSRRDPAQ
jgi:hypothetical protein